MNSKLWKKVPLMKLTEWVNRNVLDNQADIKEFEHALKLVKEELKQLNMVKKTLGRDYDPNDGTGLKISSCKTKIENLKRKSVIERIRLPI